MYYTQGKLFEHAFFFSSDEHENDNEEAFEKIKYWCNENLAGQWLIFDNYQQYANPPRRVRVLFYSRAIHNSPIDKDYSPAEIQVQSTYIISFELEEDAVAFKLRWDQKNVCGN